MSETTPEPENTVEIIPSTGLMYAPTSGEPVDRQPRPRALLMGWEPDLDNPGYGNILMVFRGAEGRIYAYNNVPQDYWIGLRSTNSVGRYLRSSGLDDWEDKGFQSGGSVSYQQVTARRMKQFGKDYSSIKPVLGSPKKMLGQR